MMQEVMPGSSLQSLESEDPRVMGLVPTSGRFRRDHMADEAFLQANHFLDDAESLKQNQQAEVAKQFIR
jgi:hypothetical protein